VTNPIPYKKREGNVERLEKLRNRDVERYVKLREDHQHAHSPDEMAIGIVDLDTEKDIITGITNSHALGLSESNRIALTKELSVTEFFSRMAMKIEVRYRSP